MFGPSDRYYDPPEPPPPCCTEGEDDPDHDVEACLRAQAEDAADAKAEREREDHLFDDDRDYMLGDW